MTQRGGVDVVERTVRVPVGLYDQLRVMAFDRRIPVNDLLIAGAYLITVSNRGEIDQAVDQAKGRQGKAA